MAEQSLYWNGTSPLESVSTKNKPLKSRKAHGNLEEHDFIEGNESELYSVPIFFSWKFNDGIKEVAIVIADDYQC